MTLTSSWKEIKKLVKDDPRYSKFSSSDRVMYCNGLNISTSFFRRVISSTNMCEYGTVIQGEHKVFP